MTKTTGDLISELAKTLFLTLTPEEFERFEDWRKRERIDSRETALRVMVRRMTDVVEPEPFPHQREGRPGFARVTASSLLAAPASTIEAADKVIVVNDEGKPRLYIQHLPPSVAEQRTAQGSEPVGMP